MGRFQRCRGDALRRSASYLATVLALVAVSALGLPRYPQVEHGPPPALAPETPSPSPLRERIGVNVVHANDPDEVARVAGWARDYHRWYWYEPERGRLTWSSGRQRIDQFYSHLSRLGVKLLVSVGMVPSWASSNGKTSGLPYPRGRSGTALDDYIAHGEYLAQLAARYGATHHREGISSADKLTGLGWVQAIEGWNEPNQDWTDPRFPAAHFARMLEVDYDGAGTRGAAASSFVGVKSGDPTILVVLPGLAGPDIAYLEATLANRTRGDRLPFDVLSFHWYAKGDSRRGGRSPEAAGLVDAVRKVRQWRDSFAPGVPIWLTELGWDTNSRVSRSHSELYAPEPTAGAYLVRSVFLSLANGVDKLFLFSYRDHDSESPGLYATAGLVENSSVDEGLDARKKAGWYYLATISRLLGSMVMASVDRQGDGNPAVYLYRLARPDGSGGAVVGWVRNAHAGRDDGSRIPSYEVSVPNAWRADAISLTADSTTGRRTSLSLADPGTTSARVEVALTEVPVVVEYWVR